MDATVKFKDGTSHTYKGVPDGTAPDVVEAQATKEFGKQVVSLSGGSAENYYPEGDKPGFVGTAVDMVRSLPGGVAKSLAGFGGFGGDMRELVSAGAGKVSGMLGGDAAATEGKARDAILSMQRFGGVPEPATSAQFNDAISKPFGGYYKPKTTLGEYAETTASFLPNAAMPGSLPAKVARVMVPGVASEAAGQATKGTGWEPAARAVGALGGGIAEGLGEGLINAKLHPQMTMEDVGKAKTANYKAAENAGVVIAPKPFQQFATDLGADITKNNVVSAKLHPQTLAALEAIQNEAAVGAPLSLERADLLRQEVTGAFQNASSRDARLLTKVKEGLDNFLDNVGPADTLSGDASVAVPILKNARQLAQREFKAKKIQELIDLAENQASTNYSGAGKEHALRAQFMNFNAQLIKDPQLAKSFTGPERAAIERVARGGPVGNALRYFGKLAPTGVISGGAGATAGAVIGSTIGGPLGAGIGSIAVPALGGLSRGGATLATSKNARVARDLMLAGGQVNPGATSIPRNAILSALLSQQNAH